MSTLSLFSPYLTHMHQLFKLCRSSYLFQFSILSACHFLTLFLSISLSPPHPPHCLFHSVCYCICLIISLYNARTQPLSYYKHNKLISKIRVRRRYNSKLQKCLRNENFTNSHLSMFSLSTYLPIYLSLSLNQPSLSISISPSLSLSPRCIYLSLSLLLSLSINLFIYLSPPISRFVSVSLSSLFVSLSLYL